jgi:hypothetical protein
MSMVVTLVGAEGSTPYTHTPSPFSSSISLDRLTTRATRMWSNAPADTFATTGVNPTARRSGMKMPWTPAASAVRNTAPRL